MSSVCPQDQAARDAIVSVLDKNMLVEAGAGSGKTSCLVKRMTALVRSGTCRISEIAAITFTRKAADELKGRFQTELEKTLRNETDEEAKGLIEQALLDYDQCFLGTIHSFCARLLRERPIEAKLDPAFEELDELGEKVFREQAWASFLEYARINEHAMLADLDKIGVSPVDLKSTFGEVSRYPDVVLQYAELEKPDFSFVLDELVCFLNEAERALPDREPKKGYDKLQQAILKALRKMSYLDMTIDKYVAEILSLFDKNLPITQNRWPDKEIAKELHTRHKLIREGSIQPLLCKWREYRHYYVMRFALVAARYYEDLRKQQSLMNFQDLLMATRDLLKRNSEVRSYFQNKYRRLLVDEFQDTDPIQAEIVFYLSGSDVNEGEWKKLKPNPGSLFVVGDPKQSIYRFRRADIDTYQLVKDLIREQGGLVEDLTTNFRSAQPLCEWLNTAIGRILPDEQDKYQAKFEAMHWFHESQSEYSAPVEVLKTADIYKKKEDIVTRDAEQIARYISWATGGNLKLQRTEEELQSGLSDCARLSDFMILLRYKDSMETYVKALASYGIEVSLCGAVSGSEFFEVRELLKVLEALQDYQDPVKLVAALRGLFFGISDDALYQFKTAGGNLNFFTEIPENLPVDIQTALVESYARLKEYYRWTKVYSTITAIEKIIEDCGIVPLLLAKDVQARGCGYLYQVLELLRTHQQKGVTDYWVSVEQLKQIVEASLENELPLRGNMDNQVRIMNLHKAKGLEAPVVILAHPYKKTDIPPLLHIKRTEGQPVGYITVHKPKGYQSVVLAQPENWDEYQDEERKYQDAEEKRLLYVAATRAKNKLIISSREKSDAKKNAWNDLLPTIEQECDLPGVYQATANMPEGTEDEQSVRDQIAEFRDKHGGWIECCSHKSYLEVSPTSLKDSPYPLQNKEQGHGMKWGSVMHEVFMKLVHGYDDLHSMIVDVLREYEEPEERVDEVIKEVEKFKRSELWKRLASSEHVLTEVPFSLTLKSMEHEEVEGDSREPIILSGIVDLAFKEEDDWVIVDYKTDSYNNHIELETLIDYYSPQVVLYCQAWEQITGYTVKESALYFTTGDKYVRFKD